MLDYYLLKDKSELKRWIGDFCSLYRKCFSADISEELVKWRFIDNPGLDILMCLVFNKEKLVAVTAATPVTLCYEEKKIKAGISQNLMIDPEYRGKDIFEKMVEKLYNSMEEKGYSSVVGFPNYLSNPKFIEKVDREVIYEIPTLQLNLENVCSEIGESQRVERDDYFQKIYENVSSTNRDIYLCKNKEFFVWRYKNHPINSYCNFVIVDDKQEVQSYLILKKYEKQFNIVEYAFRNTEDLKGLIQKCIDYSYSNDIESLTLWSQIGTEEHLAFQRLGFRNQYPITYFSGKILSRNKVKQEKFMNYKNWLVFMGDNNVY